MPTSSCKVANSPRESLVAVRTIPVATLRMVIFAPSTTAPFGSSIVPCRSPVSAAITGKASRANSANAGRIRYPDSRNLRLLDTFDRSVPSAAFLNASIAHILRVESNLSARTAPVYTDVWAQNRVWLFRHSQIDDVGKLLKNDKDTDRNHNV